MIRLRPTNTDGSLTPDMAWKYREGRRKRYAGGRVGGTVVVHFIKKNMWFLETAAALLDGEDVTPLERALEHRQRVGGSDAADAVAGAQVDADADAESGPGPHGDESEKAQPLGARAEGAGEDGEVGVTDGGPSGSDSIVSARTMVRRVRRHPGQ